MSGEEADMNTCKIHGGRDNLSREEIDHIMCRLPPNQSGAGRHKCPYCAYEQGFSAGVQHAADALREMLLRTARTDEVT